MKSINYQAAEKRIHSSLNYLTPAEFREGRLQKQGAGVVQVQFLKVDEGFDLSAEASAKADTQVKLHLSVVALAKADLGQLVGVS